MSDYGEASSACGVIDREWDPDSIDFHTFNWAAEIGGDTIDTSTFILPDGMTEQSSSNTDTTATVWLSGGSACNTYRVTNRIVTAAGRQLDKTIRLVVREQ